jgi:small subunit ribosomal protein S17
MGRTRKKPEEQPVEAGAQTPGVQEEAEVAAEAPAEHQPAEETAPEEAPVSEAAAETVGEETSPAPEPEPEAPGSVVEEPKQAEEDGAETAPPAEPVAQAEPKAPAKKTRAARKETAAKRTTAKRTRASAKSARGARKPIVRTPKPERQRAKQKERQGTVVSSAMDKTIVVRVETVRPHPVYKKVVRRSAKFHAHDPGNEANVGDVVRIVETRPLSKTKTWRLAEIIEAAK